MADLVELLRKLVLHLRILCEVMSFLNISTLELVYFFDPFVS